MIICGNKMPTRCNRGFYCRSYCLLNMFRASLCPSSGAQEYYTVVAACGISCLSGYQLCGEKHSGGLCNKIVLRFPLCCSHLLQDWPSARFERRDFSEKSLSYLVPLRPKYFPHHPILKHPQPTFLPHCKRPSFTPTQNNRQHYSSVHLNLYHGCRR